MPPGNNAVGLVGSYRFAITSQPGRTDLALLPLEAETPTAVAKEHVVGAVGDLKKHSATLLKARQGATRISIVANVSILESGSAAAGQRFRTLLRVDLPENALDMSFGFNVRKPSKIAGVQINRLCRWGMGEQQIMHVQVSPLNPVPAVAITSHYATTLQADINTVPRAAPFNNDEAVAIFEELADEAVAVLERGLAYLTGEEVVAR